MQYRDKRLRIPYGFSGPSGIFHLGPRETRRQGTALYIKRRVPGSVRTSRIIRPLISNAGNL